MTNPDGTITADGFNEFITARRPPWGERALSAGAELVKRGGEYELGTGMSLEASHDVATPELVTVALGLDDDSVRVRQFELVFRRDGDLVQLVSGTWAIRCHEGRGHQELSLEPCI